MSIKYLNLSGLEDLWINIKNYILSKIPTKTSELTNDSGYLTSHQSLANYVDLNTTQTITAIKFITGGNQGKMVFKNPNYTKGDAVESGTIISRLYFGNGTSYGAANGILTFDINSSGNTSLELAALNNTASSSSRASLIITYDKSATRPRLLKSWGDFIPNSNDGYSLGNASNIWKECYCNAYYLGTTAFGDIVTHNASEFLTSHQSLSNYVTLNGEQTISGNKTFTGTLTGTLTGNCSGSSSSCTGNAATASKVVATVANNNTGALVQGTMGTNDCFRIAIGGASNAGWAEIATGDDYNEPIYVRQYQGAFTTLKRTATLLDASGNTSFPGTVTATGFSGVPTGTSYVAAVKDGGALVNSQATAWGAIWRAPTKDYQVAGATWSNTNNNVYICYSVTNANAEAGTNTVAKSLIWAADTGTLTTTTFSGALSGNASTATQFSANTTVALTGDATGTSAGSKKGWSVPVTLANSGVTAGDYGPSANASPSHGGTFSVPYVTVDAKGRITAASTKTITLPADSNTDTKVTQTVTTGNSAYPVLLCATANATTTGTTTSRFSEGLTVNTRYSSIYITNKYNTANTKGVRDSTKGYLNGDIIFRCYDASEMGCIHCESSKYGYQQTYMQARSYIKNGAISPEGTATTCYITVRVRDNGSKTIHTDGVWENSLIPYANETYDLGTSSLQWKNAYAVNIYENGTALSSKYLTVSAITGGASTSAGNITPVKGTIILGFAESNYVTYSTNFGGVLTSPTYLYYATCVYYTSNSTMAYSKGPSVGGTGTWKLMGGGESSPGSSTKLLFGLWVKIV